MPAAQKAIFAKPRYVELVKFDGGLNDKDSPLLLADNELAECVNYHLDQRGTLTKRTGFTARYASPFGSGPVKGLFNYRKEDGTSRLIIANDGELLSDLPNFLQLWDTQAQWETSGVERDMVTTSEIAGDAKPCPGSKSAPGKIALGSIGARAGGTPEYREAVWRSQSLDISAVDDKTTGRVIKSVTLPAGTTQTIQTRTSADNVTFGSWTALGASDTIQSVGTDDYIQIRVRFNSTSGARASVQSLQVVFDETGSPTAFASGLSTSADFMFATQNDTLWIVNGEDANRQWDGTTFAVQGGSPPAAKYVAVHKNYQFLAGVSAQRSRLYFSDLADPETWPALNFVDVGKGDGDAITGLGILYDSLVITKENSVWTLQGDAPSNFTLRRETDEGGAVSMYSMVFTKNTLGWVGKEGIRFFDGVRSAIGSEKIEGTFDGLNKRQLALCAAAVFDEKIYFAVPNGASQLSNNLVLVFDAQRGAWFRYSGINAAKWCVFRQFNQDTLLFGSSTTGQVYEMDGSLTDDGSAIDAHFVTKGIDFGAPVNIKRIRSVLISAAEPDGQATSASVYLRKDLGSDSSPATISLSASDLQVKRIRPGAIGVSIARTLGIKVRHNTTTEGFQVYSVVTEYVPKAIRETT